MLGGAVVIELPEGGTDQVAEVSPAGVPASGRSRQLRSGHPAPPSQIPHYQTSHASRRTDPRSGVHIKQLSMIVTYVMLTGSSHDTTFMFIEIGSLMSIVIGNPAGPKYFYRIFVYFYFY